MNKPKLPPILSKLSHGTYYLYTYKNQWDPEKKRSRRIQSKKVGVLISGGKEGRVKWDSSFIDLIPELEFFRCEKKGKEFVFTPINEEGLTPSQALETKQLQGGATWALDEIVSASPIGKALKRAFPNHKDYLKILSVAYFLILRGSNCVCEYEEFAEGTRLPWRSPMSGATVGRLFQRISLDGVEKYFSYLREEWFGHQRDQTEAPLVLALDSTSISSYAKDLDPVERGRNKDEEDLPQINLLMLVDQKSGLPLYYKHYDGNVPDVSTIRRVIADSARLKLNNIVLVTDRGYSSTQNVNDCLRNKVGFIFNMKSGVKNSLVQDLIDQARPRLKDVSSFNFYNDVYEVSTRLDWAYDPQPVAGKRARYDEKVPLNWHIYYDEKTAYESRQTLLERIRAITKKIDCGQVLDQNQQELFDNLFAADPETKAFKPDNQKILDYLAYAGYRVLLTDQDMSASDVWQAYKERWSVEEAFKTLKSKLSCSRCRVSKNSSLNGKIFVQFIATSISMLVRRRLRAYALESKTKGQPDLIYSSDKKVLSKLHQIKLVKFPDGYYFGEVAGKRRKFFEALGVSVPDFEQGTSQMDEEDCG